MTYSSPAVAPVIAALSDPTRRSIFERLAQSPSAVGELAADLPVSRPAVSQHLKVLKDAGLVTDTADGARRIYHIDPRGVGAMRDWLDAHWRSALDAFAAFADAEADRTQTPAQTQNDGPASGASAVEEEDPQ